MPSPAVCNGLKQALKATYTAIGGRHVFNYNYIPREILIDFRSRLH